MSRNHLLSTLILLVVLLLAVSGTSGGMQSVLAQASVPLIPGKLAIYYGYPSAVNGAHGDVNQAVVAFAAYNAVVFGDTLQLPQHDPNDPNSNPNYDKACNQNRHEDHNNTVAIIQQLTQNGTEVYGYISIGGENTARRCDTDGDSDIDSSDDQVPLTEQEMEQFILAWRDMGVTGIFLDEAGYDFGTSRARQNQVVDFVHSTLGLNGQPLSVFINAFNQQDIFEPTVVDTVTFPGGQTSSVAMNPNGEPTHLGSGDISLLESFQIIQGNFQAPSFWQDRSDRALYYNRLYGTEFATVTTAVDTDPDCGFDQIKFDYAWWSTLLYGFDYMAWGEGANFSATGQCDSSLPYRQRPNERIASDPTAIDGEALGTALTSPKVSHDLFVHRRTTDSGTIEVDTNAHTGQFSPHAPYVVNGTPASLAVALAHWWPADGSATDVVGSAHGTIAAYQSYQSWFTPGKVGQAFRFDGEDDFIDFGSDAAITGVDPFSVEAWIKTTDSEGVILQQRDFVTKDINNNDIGFDGQYVLSVGWSPSGNGAAGKICWSTYSGNAYGFDFCSTASVNDGAWHHVVGIRESSGNGIIYVDGVATLAPSFNSPSTLKTLHVYAGANKRDNTAFLHGLLDELTVYTGALSGNDVSALFNAGSAGKVRSGTHAQWVFSDAVSTLTSRDQLVQRSADSGVGTLYLSVYQPIANGAGRLMYEDAAIADLITKAHAQGIQVWAAYGAPDWPSLGCASTAFPLQRMQEVVAYNIANPTAVFDGVILDVEPTEPQAASDYQALLGLYACTLDILEANGMGLQAAIRSSWDGTVEYPASSRVSQKVYEHIVDMDLHQIVVMGYRDFAGPASCNQDGIVCLDQDEVAYAQSQGRIGVVVAGLETNNCATGCGPETVTFFEEGQAEMNREAACVAANFAEQLSFGGFAIHGYLSSYLSGSGNWPATNSSFRGTCEFAITFDARTLSAPDFHIDSGSVGAGATAQETTLYLTPGDYTFSAPPNVALFNFKVQLDGTLYIDPSLHSYVGIAGTRTLVVSGHPVGIDATALSAPDFNVNFNAAGQGQTNTVTQLHLLPGSYDFFAPASAVSMPFTVTQAGTGDIVKCCGSALRRRSSRVC